MMKNQIYNSIISSARYFVISAFASLTLYSTPVSAENLNNKKYFTKESQLNFNKIVNEGNGSKGVDLRKDRHIVNFKSGDWFCLDTGTPLGENATLRLKIKKKSSKDGTLKVLELSPNGELLATVSTSGYSRSKYKWTPRVKLDKTSRQILCFSLEGASIQIEDIGITRQYSY